MLSRSFCFSHIFTQFLLHHSWISLVSSASLVHMSIYSVTKFPLPLNTPLPTTFTAQCALLESSLLSSSRLNQALLLAANLCPSPTLATLPIKQAELALAAVTLSSLLNSDRITATNWSDFSDQNRILTIWPKWSEFGPIFGIRSDFYF